MTLRTGLCKIAAFINSVALSAAVLLVSGCDTGGGSGQWIPSNIINVATMSTEITPVSLSSTLQGRVKAIRSANIHPQVSGIITERLFKQGDTLQKGAPLFQIDAQNFSIDVEASAAALMNAEAVLALQQSKLDRLSKLVVNHSASKEAFETARFNQKMAAANVQQRKAELARSKLQLHYSTVTAPISGTIGEVMITEGALVSPADNQAMAKIQQIDKVYIDVRQTAAKIMQLRQSKENRPVTILVSDNRADDMQGHTLFSDISVDESTGDLMVRIEVDNPKQVLLPGMFVRVLLSQPPIDVVKVPQQAVLRHGDGDPYVNVIIADKAEAREVTIAGIQDGKYIVINGLGAQEIVIIEGNENLRPDVELNQSVWLSTKKALTEPVAMALTVSEED